MPTTLRSTPGHLHNGYRGGGRLWARLEGGRARLEVGKGEWDTVRRVGRRWDTVRMEGRRGGTVRERGREWGERGTWLEGGGRRGNTVRGCGGEGLTRLEGGG